MASASATLPPRIASGIAVRRRGGLRLGSLLLAVLAVALARPSLTVAWTANTYSSASESLLVQLHNQARANAGLRALSVDSTLTREARARSKDMIDRNYFSHSIPPDGHKVFDELRSMGYCFVVAGENIGWNTYPDETATQAIFNGFMGSSSHYSNIMGAAWTVIGIGAYQGTTDKKMWTVLFAQKCGGTTATPKPAPKPTPKPAPKATPKPVTPKPATPKPAVAPLPAAATPAATLAPAATPPPDPTFPPDPDPEPLGWTPGWMLTTASPRPSETAMPAGPPDGLRVVEEPGRQGLFESIVGDVTGVFFGS